MKSIQVYDGDGTQIQAMAEPGCAFHHGTPVLPTGKIRVSEYLEHHLRITNTSNTAASLSDSDRYAVISAPRAFNLPDHQIVILPRQKGRPTLRVYFDALNNDPIDTTRSFKYWGVRILDIRWADDMNLDHPTRFQVRDWSRRRRLFSGHEIIPR